MEGLSILWEGLINPLETMSSLPFKQQPHKMVKHVSPVCGVGV